MDATLPTPDERRAEMLRAEAGGVAQEFLFFWNEPATASGALGPGCLSQFWPAPFSVDGVTYPTAEHWMMAGKARLFGDDQVLETILHASMPQEAKAAGRAVRGFSEDGWQAARYKLVVTGNLAKFSQHDDLGRYLTSTGGRVLVEASPFDRIWGIGLSEDDERAASPSRWRGLNLLGFALMEVRDRLSRGAP